MEHKVEYDITSGICEVRVNGVHNRPQDSLELLRIAAAYAKEHKCFRFLFDMREANIVGSVMGAYDTVIDPEKYGISRLFRIAAVYSEVTENEKFMEDVGVNRGADSYKVFYDIDAARKWISEE